MLFREQFDESHASGFRPALCGRQNSLLRPLMRANCTLGERPAQAISKTNPTAPISKIVY